MRQGKSTQLRKSAKSDHRCCPFVGQTWIALAFLLLVLLLMSFMQLYSDSLPDYPPECVSLIDFSFRVLPKIPVPWLADVWIGVSLLIFILLIIFVLDTPQLVLRRFVLLLGIVFLFRTVVIADTRYPSLANYTERYRPSNWFVGALLIIGGVHKTASDMLFSGHTTQWVLTGWMVTRYSNFAAYSVLFWLFNFTGIFILLSVEEHYLSDVVVAIIVASLTFLSYHLIFDRVTRKALYKSLLFFRWLDHSDLQ